MEATYSNNQSSSSHGWLLFVAFAVIAAGLYLAVATAPARPVADPALSVSGHVIVDRNYSHAWEHDDQDIVRNCLDSGRTWKRWYKAQQPDRYMRVCYDGENIILQIVDKIRDQLWEKTAYVNRDLQSVGDVEAYARAVNYAKIKIP